MVFHLVGGLGLFLVGINIMSENLKSLAGNKMKKITFMGIKRLCKLRNCAKAMEKN